MPTKLTLAMDEAIIKRAKKYAQKRKLSLSKLVEFYFASITSEKGSKAATLPPITSELSGMVKVKTISKDKTILADALIDKYL